LSHIRLLGTAYQTIYEAVANPASGYTDADTILLHTPDQISAILDLEAV